MSAEFPRVPRVWPGAVFSPGRWGIVHPSLPWRDVMEAYYWDNLRVAMKLADDAGLGLNAVYLSVYRMIEAEHVTRESSVMSDRGDWLLVEHIPDSHETQLPQIEALVRAGCDETAEAFGWQHGPAVLFTVLHPDANAPYVPGRHGFFIDKYPFDKVCLPTYLLDEPGQFVAAVRHEYAHAMCLNRTQGKCPTWLHEAVATIAESPGASRFGRPRRWLEPRSLESAFRDDRETEEGSASVSAAYSQARWLGQTLLENGGTKKLGELLDAFTDNTFLQNLILTATSQQPEDEALKQIYGFGVKELFKRAAH